jgi:hypothetical protein
MNFYDLPTAHHTTSILGFGMLVVLIIPSGDLAKNKNGT